MLFRSGSNTGANLISTVYVDSRMNAYPSLNSTLSNTTNQVITSDHGGLLVDSGGNYIYTSSGEMIYTVDKTFVILQTILDYPVMNLTSSMVTT